MSIGLDCCSPWPSLQCLSSKDVVSLARDGKKDDYQPLVARQDPLRVFGLRETGYRGNVHSPVCKRNRWLLQLSRDQLAHQLLLVTPDRGAGGSGVWRD